MAVRTTSAAVVDILGPHYDAVRTPSLTGFIATASSLVDKVSANDTAGKLSASDLEIIERWLSGHFYQQSDQMFTSRSTGKASGSFQGQTGMGLENSIYGQTAMSLDVTRYLAALNKGGIVGGAWLGKPLSEQLTYDERN